VVLACVAIAFNAAGVLAAIFANDFGFGASIGAGSSLTISIFLTGGGGFSSSCFSVIEVSDSLGFMLLPSVGKSDSITDGFLSF
jgi:hypothetical protein